MDTMRIVLGSRCGTGGAAFGATALAAILLSTGCMPTVRVEVAPINIYAKLDADVRVRLDQEVQTLIQQNPNLF